MRVDPLSPRGASSGDVPPPPSSTSVDAAETFGADAVATADIPPSTTSDDSDIRRTLDHVLTIKAAQGQILVDVLDEIRGLREDLARFRSLHRHLLLMMDFDCPLAFRHKKREYI